MTDSGQATRRLKRTLLITGYIVLGLVIAIVLITILGVCLAGNDSPNEVSDNLAQMAGGTTNAPPQAASPPPSNSQTTPSIPSVGTTLGNDDLLVQVVSVDYSRICEGCEFGGGDSYAEDGMVYALVEAIILNSGSDTAVLEGASSFKLLDGNGTAYDSEFLVADTAGPLPYIENLSPNQRIAGTVFFELPDTIQTAKLLYEFNVLFDQVGEWTIPVSIPATLPPLEAVVGESLERSGITVLLSSAEFASICRGCDFIGGNAVPDAGQTYLILDVVITNAGNSPEFTGRVDFSLLGQDGTTYDPSFSVTPMPELESTSVPPGGRIAGKMVFEVPFNTLSATLLYEFDLFPYVAGRWTIGG